MLGSSGSAPRPASRSPGGQRRKFDTDNRGRDKKKGSGSSYQQRGPEPRTETEWLQVVLGMSQGGVRRPLPAQLPKTEEEEGGNQVYNSIHWKEQNQLQRKEQCLSVK